jgi:hypothetical protein
MKIELSFVHIDADVDRDIHRKKLLIILNVQSKYGHRNYFIIYQRTCMNIDVDRKTNNFIA